MTAPTLHPNKPPAVLLMGGVSSGKTESLRTLVDAGLEVFIIKTEPSEVLDNTDPTRVHWRYIAPALVPWTTMVQNSRLMNTLTYKDLCNIEEMDRSKYTQYIDVLNACNNFVDDRTGKAYGDVMAFGPDKAFGFDGLSGLSDMALDLIVGGKPVKGKEQYGVAMENLLNLTQMLVSSLQCTFFMCAHLGSEPSEEARTNKMMPDTLGQKLAPKMVKPFSDIIHTIRDNASPPKWRWSTLTYGFETKARNVPWSDNLPPSFVPLIETWRRRAAAGAATPPAPK
jgi:hypothetical protein